MGLNWQSLKLKLSAEIAGTSFDDVVAFSSSFDVNSIPTAQLVVAIGRSVKTGQPATIHSLAAKLGTRIKAKVYLEGSRADGAAGGAGLGKKLLIFEGYVIGTGPRRSRGEASFVIHLVHWLIDLHLNSTLSAMMHPDNPADFSFGTVTATPDQGQGGGLTIGGAYVSVATVQKALAEAALQDLWSSVFSPWMREVASFNFTNPAITGQLQVAATNPKPVLDALARLDNDKGCKRVPLELTLEGLDAGIVRSGITTSLAKETINSWENTTLWGKLVGEWAPSYMFSVIPRISNACVVPFVGPRKQVYTTIHGSEYEAGDANNQIPQSIKGVAIIHAAAMMGGGLAGTGQHATSLNGLAGWFNGGADRDGIIIAKSPPGWLAETLVSSHYTRDAVGADADVIANAFYPNEGKDLAKKSPKQIHKELIESSICDRYAHQLFVMEMLKGRSAEISGKLRFDIAPGSSVRIMGAGERFLGKDALGVPIIATVAQVSYAINTETSKVGTGFALTQVRTEAENNNPNGMYSLEKPPLYEKDWLGCALHDDF